jgi:alpha-L-fucosidase
MPSWRSTSAKGKLYVHLLEWPEGEFRVAGVQGKATKACLLADSERSPLPIKQTGSEVTVKLPEKAPGALVNVLCLTLQSQNNE